MNLPTRIIPAKQWDELFALCKWQLEAPIDLTNNQIDECTERGCQIFEAAGQPDLILPGLADVRNPWGLDPMTLLAELEDPAQNEQPYIILLRGNPTPEAGD